MLIFMYHRINEHTTGPYRLAVRPEEFEAQLTLVARYCEPSTLDEIGRRSDRPRAVITFDDGYADNYEIAAPIAERLGFPIVVYVTSGIVGDPRGFWWDRLVAIINRANLNRGTRHAEVQVDIGCTQLAVRGLDRVDGARSLLWALHSRLRVRRRPEIEALLDEVAAQLGVDPGGNSDDRVLTHSELHKLSGMPHVEIGAHTADHDLLARLLVRDQEEQMRRSRDDLKASTGQEVRHLAYPFGGLDAVSSASVRAARRLRFATAATTRPGPVRSFTPHHQLPRHMVHPGDSPQEMLVRAGVSTR